LVIVLIGLVRCNSAGDDLSGIIAFDSAAECRLAPHTLRIFDAMIACRKATGPPTRGEPITIAGVGTIRPAFSGPDDGGMVHAQLPLNGSWHGLTITGIGHGFVPNSGVSYNRILFAGPPDEVRRKLNPMGFGLPPDGKAREFGNGLMEYISVVSLGTGNVLRCST
jgi:hypothetical protein